MNFDPNEFLWVEKWRPKTVDECIIPDRLKIVFQQYIKDKRIPNLLLSGGPGIGKTTIAKALCYEVGCEFMVINASEARGIETLRIKITNYASTSSLNGEPKVLILDEADYITAEAQAAFRGLIEEYSQNITYIFTCNFPYKLIEALHSRCTGISFNLDKKERPEMAKKFAKRLMEILNQEKVKYSKTALITVVQKYFPDYRKILGELQNLARVDGIQDDVVKSLLDPGKIQNLIQYLRTKSFGEMRKWVEQNLEDSTRFYRQIYDALLLVLSPDSIPLVVLLVARYQKDDPWAIDKGIHITALLTEIMDECKFI